MPALLSRVDQPLPNVWTDRNRGLGESALDSETAVSLACHLHDVFVDAPDWNTLIHSLEARNFSLEFQNDRLTLVNDQTGIGLCTCAFLGHSLAVLAARLGKPCVLASTGKLVPKPT